MRRLVLGYVLMPCVLLATGGLAYYSYVSSLELAGNQRQLILETTRALADEKVNGVEELLRANTLLFEGVRLDNLRELRQRVNDERPAVRSVVVLDDKHAIMTDGFYTKRTGREELAEFRRLFETRVVPDLQLDSVKLNERRHLLRHYVTTINVPDFLFSYTKRIDHGVSYFVVVEADITYLWVSVFPPFFGNARDPRLYQILDERNDLRYGFAFAGIPEPDVVQVPFPDVLKGWRLRVAQRRGLGGADRGRALDLVLIGTALAVILVGMGVLLWAERSERRANALKSEFISNVSHELKTPLSIISMFAEMLAMGRTQSATQSTEYANIITRESIRLSRLIDNVLDFAKIERGVDVYEFADGDLGAVVERVLDIYRHRIEQYSMALEIDLEPDLPPVRIDENAMTLALLNLVDNAIKYAAAGKRLVVSLRRDGDRVALAVRDFGPGIPAEEQGLIFERFYRARAVRLKPVRGSGIGLALVRHIAEAHGGSVEVASVEGEGTTFTVWIPASASVE